MKCANISSTLEMIVAFVFCFFHFNNRVIKPVYWFLNVWVCGMAVLFVVSVSLEHVALHPVGNTFVFVLTALRHTRCSFLNFPNKRPRPPKTFRRWEI